MEGLIVILEEVRDPRKENARHPLSSVLFIALAATLCGSKTCVDIADFAEAQAETLGEIVDLPHGPPSHDTFSRVLRVLDPEALSAAFTRFVAALRQALGATAPGIVSIDAKSLRGAYDKGKAHMPALMVGVWDSQTRLAIAQARAPDGNEVAAALALLKAVVLKGSTLTGDALYCRADVAGACRKAKAHYALKLKANNPTLLRHVEEAFHSAGPGIALHETIERKHGRRESRIASVVSMRKFASPDWPDLACAIRVQTERTVADAKTQKAVRYMISSRSLSPHKALEVFRGHWGIENKFHWPLDVIFDEDDARSRKDYAPQNLAVIRRFAYNILQAHPDTKSIGRKMKRALWSKEFFFELFAHMR